MRILTNVSQRYILKSNGFGNGGHAIKGDDADTRSKCKPVGYYYPTTDRLVSCQFHRVMAISRLDSVFI